MRVKLETVYKETYNEVPAGGTEGQILKKVSDTNYDTAWETVSGTGTGFVELTDTPSSYVGEAGKVLQVNSTEDGLEFATSSGGGGVTSGRFTPSTEENKLTNASFSYPCTYQRFDNVTNIHYRFHCTAPVGIGSAYLYVEIPDILDTFDSVTDVAGASNKLQIIPNTDERYAVTMAGSTTHIINGKPSIRFYIDRVDNFATTQIVYCDEIVSIYTGV